MGILDKVFGVIHGAPEGMPFILQNDIEMACKTLKNIYVSNNRYTETFMHAYMNIMINIDRRIRLREDNPLIYEDIAALMRQNSIRNFTDLVLVHIYVTTVPPTAIDLYGFANMCGDYVTKRLLFHKLPSLYVYGNNTHLTKDLIDGV